jgi:dTDP-4-amino-4,6-dideoxygalactose transaminase
MGPEVEAFERELEQYLGVAHVITVNSCTSALFLSLLALGVGPGDEVICPSLTWCSTANAALYLGATPVFSDVDPHTLNVTPELVAVKLTDKTKAVVPVHFGGLAVDVAALRRSLPESVHIVEDAAHAIGALYPDGSMVGSSGNLVCFSFYANKNISTGEGGAIALADSALAGRLSSLRQHGLQSHAWKRFIQPKCLLTSPAITELGFKMNYIDLQACIGRVQLKRFKDLQANRLAIAERYAAGLTEMGIRFQRGCLDPGHARHLFVVMFDPGALPCSRDEVAMKLRERNICASIHYAPLHGIPLYRQAGDAPALENTDRLAPCVMTLPISASMSVEDADYVLEHLRRVACP